MARFWKPAADQFVNFHFGTRAGKGGFPVHGNGQPERDRRLSRSRINLLRINQSKNLVSFPPLKGDNAEEKDGETRTLSGWNSLFKEPMKIQNVRVLSFFKPSPPGPGELPFVTVSEEAVNREARRWESCLIAYVVGKRPFFQALKDRLEAQWDLSGPFQMHSLPGGFFLFCFNGEADRARLLCEGPWSFYGRPIVIKEWVPGMELKKEFFNALPIWIRLPNLDLRFWDVDSISRIASVVGHPRFVDEATANRDRLSFARVCVEVTPLCEFPSKVNILVGTKGTLQNIHYEWRPPSCRFCNSFDHSFDSCSLTHGPERDSGEMLERGEESRSEWQNADHRKSTRNQANRMEFFSKRPESIWREKVQAINEDSVTFNAFSPLQEEETAQEVAPEIQVLSKVVGSCEGDYTPAVDNISVQCEEVVSAEKCILSFGASVNVGLSASVLSQPELNQNLKNNTLLEPSRTQILSPINQTLLPIQDLSSLSQNPSSDRSLNLNLGLLPNPSHCDPNPRSSSILEDNIVLEKKEYSGSLKGDQENVAMLSEKDRGISKKEFVIESENENEVSVPPGFNEGVVNMTGEESIETAIHVSAETSESEEEAIGSSSSQARMIREKLGISFSGTGNADKAFADFCRKRPLETEAYRKKSVVPDASINLRKQVGKKGVVLKGDGRKKR